MMDDLKKRGRPAKSNSIYLLPESADKTDIDKLGRALLSMTKKHIAEYIVARKGDAVA